MRRTGRILIVATFVALAGIGCGAGPGGAESDRQPRKAGTPEGPADVAGHIVAARAAAIMGDQEAVVRHMNEAQDDFRRAIKLADPARAVDRESARHAARRVPGVRSVAWVDRENLFVIVETNGHRTYGTIDAICMELEPLGDTLGVVVNLQSGAATNGDQLEILSRNCQLAPGDRALLSRPRSLDVISPTVREQHRRNQALATQDEEARRRQEESLKVLERSTPSVYD